MNLDSLIGTDTAELDSVNISCTVGIGSNLGQPAENVLGAMAALRKIGELAAVSSLYRTAPWGVKDQPYFCNAVALLRVTLEAKALLEALKRIERDFGSTKEIKWGPRLIDLDLLTYGNQSINEPGLVVPHPQMLNRAFVLVPLSEILPQYSKYLVDMPPSSLEDVRLWGETCDPAIAVQSMHPLPLKL